MRTPARAAIIWFLSFIDAFYRASPVGAVRSPPLQEIFIAENF
jgi:hypothetical protein